MKTTREERILKHSILNNFVKILSPFSYKLCGFICVYRCRHISRAFVYKLIHAYPVRYIVNIWRIRLAFCKEMMRTLVVLS